MSGGRVSETFIRLSPENLIRCSDEDKEDQQNIQKKHKRKKKKPRELDVKVSVNDNPAYVTDGPGTALNRKYDVNTPPVEGYGQERQNVSQRGQVGQKEFVLRICCAICLVEDKKSVPKKISDKPSDKQLCECGLAYNKHSEKEKMLSVNGEWNPATHTASYATDSFGLMKFKGRNTVAKYIRVGFLKTIKDESSDKLVPDWNDRELLRRLWVMMNTQWKIPTPKLIISVTGGAKRFELRSRLKETVKRGLIKTATATDAWLVTGGTSTGVMEFVAEAIKEHEEIAGSTRNDIIALGIAPWGTIINNDQLKNNGLYNTRKYQDYVNTGPDVRGYSYLDANHSHFILVDDGTTAKFGTEIKLRTALEQYISTSVPHGLIRQNTKGQTGLLTDRHDNKIPIVVLVLEGGANTLETAFSAMQNESPIVVIKGSGRAADLIAMAYADTTSRFREIEPKLDEKMYKEKMYEMFDLKKELNEEKRNKTLNKSMENLKSMMKQLNLITVFNLADESTNEIDEAILKAVLKAKHTSLSLQLNLALAWDRWDIARDMILTTSNKANWANQTDVLREAMSQALVDNRVQFIHLLIESGVDLGDFLTMERLADLYDNATDLVKRKARWDKLEHTSTAAQKLHAIGHLINNLLDGQIGNIYSTDKRSETDIVEDLHTNSQKHLFLWAILHNLEDMAFLFWKLCDDHIANALVASAILRQLSEDAMQEVEIEQQLSLENHSNAYEQRAVDVLGVCHNRDKFRTHQLLVRRLRGWGETSTLFTIASNSNHMEFINHQACQAKLSQIWKGKIATVTPMYMILLTLFFPFIIFWFQFEEDEGSNKLNIDVGEVMEDIIYDDQELNQGKSGSREILSVGFLSNRSEKRLSFVAAWYHFICAPVVKFCYYTITYVVFLGLFSYFVMVDLRPTSDPDWAHPTEFIMWFYALTLIIEEVRQLRNSESHYLKYKVRDYFSNSWNKFDILLYLLLIFSIILRFSLESDAEHFVWARNLYCLTLICYYLRFLQTFYAFMQIGPKVVMLQRMLSDLSFFICLMLVFIFAYGVAAQALNYPMADPSWHILYNVTAPPYWSLFNLGPTEFDNGLVTILLAIYMMIISCMLLNILVALFSYTFQQVQDNSSKVWRFVRMELINEYHDKPILPPPFIIINHVFRIIVNCITKKTHVDGNDFNVVFSEPFYKVLTKFEHFATDHYTYKKRVAALEGIDAKVDSTSTRIDRVIRDLETIKDQIEQNQKPEESGKRETTNAMRINEELESEEECSRPNREIRSLQKDIYDLKQHIQNLTQYIMESSVTLPGQVAPRRPTLEIHDQYHNY